MIRQEVSGSSLTISRRRLLTLLTIVSGTGLQAACGVAVAPPSAPTPAATPIATPTPSARSGALRLFVWAAPAEQAGLAAIQAGFRAANPNVTLRITTMDRGASYYDRLQALAAAGTPPGAFRLEPAWFAALAGKGLPAQLDAYVAAQKYPLQDDWSTLVASYRWQGALMALPELGNAQVILYNPGLFAKASVPDPNAADATRQWTWPTMLSAAQRLTRGSGATQQFGFAFDATIERLLPWIWSDGGQMFTDDAKPTTLDMGNSNTVQAIQWLADMGTRFHVAPTPAEQQGMSLDALFAAGRLAMYATVTDMAAVTRQVNGAFAWDMTPLPVGNAGRFNLAGGSAYSIAAASTSAELAWAFLAYAGGPSAQQQYAQRAIGVPARQSLTGAGWLDAPAPPAHRQPLMTGMQEAKPIPPARRLAQLTAQAIDPQLALLWSGQVDAKTTLAAVDQKGNAILDGAT